MLKNIVLPLMALWTCLVFTGAKAEIFCVTNSAELATALSDAGSNLENDIIRIAQGSYNNGVSGFSYNSTETFDLTLTGGWANVGGNCVIQNVSPYLSVFDGSLIGPNLSITMGIGGNVSINNLSFINGFGTSLSRGVGLLVNTQGGTVLIERNVFSNNRSTFCAAMCLTTRNEITVRNNVFAMNNVSSGQGVINITNFVRGVYFVNNTVVDNTHTSALTDAYAGLDIFTRNASPAFIANNILWDNLAGDLVMRDDLSAPSDVYLYNNIYFDAEGDFTFMANNLNQDPLLEGSQLFNYSPSLPSPARDAGRPMPPDMGPPGFENEWDHGFVDLIGTARIQDDRVDIGAREATPEPPIFENGFE